MCVEQCSWIEFSNFWWEELVALPTTRYSICRNSSVYFCAHTTKWKIFIGNLLLARFSFLFFCLCQTLLSIFGLGIFNVFHRFWWKNRTLCWRGYHCRAHWNMTTNCRPPSSTKNLFLPSFICSLPTTYIPICKQIQREPKKFMNGKEHFAPFVYVFKSHVPTPRCSC